MRALDLESASSLLDWKEFERFASLAFESLGYETEKNYRLKKPRIEIDILAHRGNAIAFAVDCKHWKRTVGHASMLRICERQVERSLRLIGSFQRIVPVVLTWHDEMLRVIENGVPVVPIHKLSDFLVNWESSETEILVLEGKLAPVERDLTLDKRYST